MGRDGLYQPWGDISVPGGMAELGAWNWPSTVVNSHGGNLRDAGREVTLSSVEAACSASS